MAGGDHFGLKREKRIVESGVRNVFTPHRPVTTLQMFFGRSKVVQRLVAQTSTPGQHSLVYGDRGVGKTSLANAVKELVMKEIYPKGKVFAYRCDSSTNFRDITRDAFEASGGTLPAASLTTTSTRSREHEITAKVYRHDRTNKESTTEARDWGEQELSPGLVAKQLADFVGLLVVDEADAILDSVERKKLAELIKLLSDAGSPFKVMIVGIASSGDQLTSAHPSVQRCLTEIGLPRMTDDELREIIHGCSRKVGLRFHEIVANHIVRISAGYPHFTHLLALKCAEEAVAGGRKDVGIDDLRHAMKTAVEEAEGTLRRVYEAAIRSAATDQYEKILFSAANCKIPEFSAADLRIRYEKDHGSAITQSSLNNYFQRLVSDGTDTVIQRVAKGVYRFTDPRMPSYIKIASGLDPAARGPAGSSS